MESLLEDGVHGSWRWRSHDEQIDGDGDGDPQCDNGLYQVISVLMPFLLYSTFICDDVLPTYVW